MVFFIQRTNFKKGRYIVYVYFPNAFAIEKFKLTEKEYSCGSLTTLFEKTLGKENYDKFMVAQDPFSNKKIKKSKIYIILNPDELIIQKHRFGSIGVVRKD